MELLSNQDILVRITVALLAGALVGMQREWRNKPAGLRTYSLVSLGAALFMLASLLLGEQAAAQGNEVYDPSRIASTIVQGIGFLAAGVIFSTKGRVRGLTTAAAVWVTAAIGLLVGAGLYVAAIAGTVATLVVLEGLSHLERYFQNGVTSETRQENRQLSE